MGVWFGSVDDDEDGEMGDGRWGACGKSSELAMVIHTCKFVFRFFVQRLQVILMYVLICMSQGDVPKQGAVNCCCMGCARRRLPHDSCCLFLGIDELGWIILIRHGTCCAHIAI